ncbi:tripartite motif-containing protein 16-like protein [Aphelenchoides avenae]|nr:tripartite motif-containing protein 16-like protein [Aphelenchus avenae]
MEEIIASALECPCCLQLVKDPMSLPCGHILCEVCLGTRLTHHTPRNYPRHRCVACPACHANFTEPRSGFAKLRQLADMLKALEKEGYHDCERCEKCAKVLPMSQLLCCKSCKRDSDGMSTLVCAMCCLYAHRDHNFVKCTHEELIRDEIDAFERRQAEVNAKLDTQAIDLDCGRDGENLPTDPSRQMDQASPLLVCETSASSDVLTPASDPAACDSAQFDLMSCSSDGGHESQERMLKKQAPSLHGSERSVSDVTVTTISELTADDRDAFEATVTTDSGIAANTSDSLSSDITAASVSSFEELSSSEPCTTQSVDETPSVTSPTIGSFGYLQRGRTRLAFVRHEVPNAAENTG